MNSSMGLIRRFLTEFLLAKLTFKRSNLQMDMNAMSIDIRLTLEDNSAIAALPNFSVIFQSGLLNDF